LGGGALVAYGFWQLRHPFSFPKRDVVFGGLAGAIGVLSSGVVLAMVMVTTGDAFIAVAKAVLWIHVGIMIFEGVVVGACVGFLLKVRPDMLSGWRPPTAPTTSTGGGVAVIAALALATAMLVPSPAQAHKLLIDYTPLEDGVLIEAFFPDGKAAQNIGVRLLEMDETIVAEAKTDTTGGHVFAIPAHKPYIADADAEMGHYNRVTIPAAELADVKIVAVASQHEGHRPSKVKAEDIPLGRVFLGFAVIAGVAMLAMKMKKG